MKLNYSRSQTFAVLIVAALALLAMYVSVKDYGRQQGSHGAVIREEDNASVVKALDLPDVNEVLRNIRQDPFYKEKTLYLKSSVYKRKIHFYSYTVEPFVGKTDVYVNNSTTSQLSLDGFFYNAYTVDINKDGKDELEVETESGHSLNSLIYKYLRGRLERIPVSTENPKGWEGIVSRNTPEFKDVNKDGLLEMLAYYRFFPPEKRRKVEVYKFTGLLFQKVREYEEKMPEVYL